MCIIPSSLLFDLSICLCRKQMDKRTDGQTEPHKAASYLPKAGLMKAGCLNTAAPRKVLRPSGAPLGGRLAEPGGGGRLGKAAAAAAAAAVQAESSAGWCGGKGLASR